MQDDHSLFRNSRVEQFHLLGVLLVDEMLIADVPFLLLEKPPVENFGAFVLARGVLHDFQNGVYLLLREIIERHNLAEVWRAGIKGKTLSRLDNIESGISEILQIAVESAYGNAEDVADLLLCHAVSLGHQFYELQEIVEDFVQHITRRQ